MFKDIKEDETCKNIKQQMLPISIKAYCQNQNIRHSASYSDKTEQSWNKNLLTLQMRVTSVWILEDQLLSSFWMSEAVSLYQGLTLKVQIVS